MTTLIGAGQGLFLALYSAEILGLIGLVAEPGNRVQALGSMISVAFLVLGLIASFFHLGHPERAWRAAAMWRTSWLSREVIVMPALMAAVSTYETAIILSNRVDSRYKALASIKASSLIGCPF